MPRQQLWRGSVSIIEQTNGYYEVRVGERWEHGVKVEDAVYEHLSWSEAMDVLQSSWDIWTDSRQLQQTTIIARSWEQAPLFLLP